jgi:hypothetical protein
MTLVVPTAKSLYHGDSQYLRKKGRRPQPPLGENVAQNHYTSKTKRRPKNSKRKDSSADTMAALRKLEAAASKK